MTSARDTWSRACTATELETDGRRIVRAGGRKLVLFATGDGPRACVLRCPHEGYPLSEGQLSEDGRLTCAWHNWKFDLASGANLTGGDALDVFEVERRGEDLWVRVVEPSPEEAAGRALSRLLEAMDEYDYSRIARELARHAEAGGDPDAAIRAAIQHSYERLDRGCSHAYAAAADWLDLSDETSEAEALACRVEAVAHIAYDVLREPQHPYPPGVAPFSADALVAAIDAEDEPRAAPLIRGAFADGRGWTDVAPALARSALAHYAGFGHAAIYLVHAGRLVDRLGEDVAPPLALSVARYHIVAARENLIPEFRGYADALAAWDGGGTSPVSAADFRGLSVRRALERCLPSSARVDELFDALLIAGAWSLLHFDVARERQTDNKLVDNAGWLDLTHHLTFAHAARQICADQPELKPAAILQLALFQGRNAFMVREDPANEAWAVEDPAAFFNGLTERLIDHGEPSHIHACHWLKTARAAQAEAADLGGDAARTIAAALNKYLNTPPKRRHALRDARQALAFVREE